MASNSVGQRVVSAAQKIGASFENHRAALAGLGTDPMLSGYARQVKSQQMVDAHRAAVNAGIENMVGDAADAMVRARQRMARAMAVPDGAREDAGRVLAPVLAVAHTNPGAVVAAYRRAVDDGDLARIGLLQDVAGSVSDAMPNETARRGFESEWAITQHDTRHRLPQAVRDAHDAAYEADRAVAFARDFTEMAGRELQAPAGWMTPRTIAATAAAHGFDAADGGEG